MLPESTFYPASEPFTVWVMSAGPYGGAMEGSLIVRSRNFDMILQYVAL
jgi:hypothetical protein